MPPTPKKNRRHARQEPLETQAPTAPDFPHRPDPHENLSEQVPEAQTSENWEVDFSSEQFRPRWWKRDEIAM
jgi:hypothetical protein